MTKQDIINLVIQKTRDGIRKNTGGPFGAAVVDANGEILAISSNRVLKEHDPTAHAEIVAIREACKKLGSHDLNGCTIYATGYPCPMCLGAIIWANIKLCYYGCTPKDAEKIGFRDDFIYRFIKRDCADSETLRFEELDRDGCLALFEEYDRQKKPLY